MRAAISSTVRSAMEQRSRPLSRLEASLKAVSDWMPRVARERVGWKSSASDFEFMVMVLLPMGLFSCRCCSGECCGEDLVEGFDGGVDVLRLEKKGREQAKDCLAGA